MSNNTLQFDLTARREKNLRVLKSVDENIIEILEDYAHVAVYQFDVDLRKWDRLDVEGTLFITRSLSDPFYSLIVLNKKGPSDFALDILNVLKISLQRPYLMLRCSTANTPITFGIWSHSEAELDALYAIIVRIALNKESPVAPPSPLQVKATQLLSMLKPRSVITNSSAQSPKSPAPSLSSNSSTLATQMSFSPEGAQSSSTSSKQQNGASAKSAALLSLLKPSSIGETESAAVQSSVASMAVADSTSTVSKSMQLLSIMKQVSQSPAPTPNPNPSNYNTTTSGTPETKSSTKSENKSETKSNGLNHIKVHKPSAPAAATVPPASSSSATTATSPAPNLEEDKRAELMMKLIKPRNTTVDDLLTDVDIAAKVKAAASAPAPAAPAVVSANNSSATTPSSQSTRSTGSAEETFVASSASSSKQDLLKNLLMSSNKPTPAPSTATSPAPTPASAPAPALPSPVTKSPAPSQTVPILPFSSPVGFQPIPSPARSSASPVTVTESATQRNADLLAAALRHSAQNIRALQVARSPTASPVLKGLSPSPPTFMGNGSGMQAPIAWASLGNGNIASASTMSAGIASGSSKGPSPNVAVSSAVPRAQPVLISPSDLRNIAAAQR